MQRYKANSDKNNEKIWFMHFDPENRVFVRSN